MVHYVYYNWVFDGSGNTVQQEKLCFDLTQLSKRSLSAVTDSYFQFDPTSVHMLGSLSYAKGMLARIDPLALGFRSLLTQGGSYTIRVEFKVGSSPAWQALPIRRLYPGTPAQPATGTGTDWSTPFYNNMPDMSCITDNNSQFPWQPTAGTVVSTTTAPIWLFFHIADGILIIGGDNNKQTRARLSTLLCLVSHA
jgi:hypothetical protein